MNERFALVCKECYSVEWVKLHTSFLTAVKGSRNWHTCESCEVDSNE